MADSLITLPLRLSLRPARAVLRATRDAADLGLAAIELVSDALGAGEARSAGRGQTSEQRHRESFEADPFDGSLVGDEVAGETAPVVSIVPDPAPDLPEPPLSTGPGAEIRIDPPFAGYDELRAPDVIARLRSVDDAELGETELYERTHRARRTVLTAIERESRRR